VAQGRIADYLPPPPLGSLPAQRFTEGELLQRPAQALFFFVFNAPDRSSESDPRIGEVPYLNGGLFEEEQMRPRFASRRARRVLPSHSQRTVRGIQLYDHREHPAQRGGRGGPGDAGQGFRGTRDGQARDGQLLHTQANGVLHVPGGAQRLPGSPVPRR
jgi:hypothetical protein